MARIGEATAPAATRDALARARMRASLVPDLLIEARRVVNTVIAGWHGRRKRGIGENFWQFRPYVDGDAFSRIDWRRSARDDHTYVRDREWQAAHTVWLWADPSQSMLYKSRNATVSKESRALVLVLALAELLSRSGERIAWPGLTDPFSARNGAERLASHLVHAGGLSAKPDLSAIRRFSDIVVAGDFLDPVEDTMAWLDVLQRHGVRAHLIEVADPAEETFPYSGRTEFSDPETGAEADRRPRRDGFGRLPQRLPGAAARARRPLQAARLELYGQSHRPAGFRSADHRAFCAVGRRLFRRGAARMSWLPLSFGFPAILFGLIALPVIWWLLRLTPPRPQTEVFPPLQILARVLKKEETPHQSPWWLTLLRLLMAALVVLALAEPIYNPRQALPSGGNALALVIDNGWASAGDWDKRVATAERLIADAEKNERRIVLAFTAEKSNAQIGPFTGQEARDRLNAVKPRPVPTDRPDVYARVAKALVELPGAMVAILTDGLATKDDAASFATLLGQSPASVVWAVPDQLDMVGLTAADNEVDRFTITAVRPPAGAAPRFMTAGAFDDKGRRIGDAAVTFRPGETVATGEIVVPFELRNDFASIALDGETHAGAVRVLDETDKRRRVGLLSQTPVDQARLLLSPLYYIRRALEPFADLVEPSEPGPDRGDPATAGAKAGRHRDGRCRNHSRKHAQAADRLDGKRRHAGALRQLAAAERRQ